MARGVQKVGDWRTAHRILAAGPLKLQAAADRAVLKEAHLFRKEIVQGITKQAPGGEAFKPLAETTLATRKFRGFKGTKALIVHGDLRNAVTVIKRRGEAFVGIPRTAKGREGEKLVNVAEVQEFGSRPIVIAMSEKMRRLLHKMFRLAGLPPGEGGGGAVAIVQVPARPFLRPVFDKLAPGAAKRFAANVAAALGGDFGRAM
jgi:hypothetical protein